MTIIPILLKIGPWLLAAAGVLFGVFRHQQARTATAQAGQKAAEAQATAAAAREQVAQSANAEAQANADAAQAGAAAAKERSDAETNVGALPAGGAEQRLRDGWSRD
ncbi:hypothetical protein [Burkholderia cenocepacia]|uniref:hypothetical protein n=1 Tax=Burkholderia cenocepacia TaxID=95486 RepID=UPI003846C73F